MACFDATQTMIKEAILAHPEAARTGLSRQLLKKWIQAKHPATAALSTAAFSNLLGRAITKGAEKKVFVLPKGPSGKVKLAPGTKAAVAKEQKPKAEKKPKDAKTTKPKTATAKKPAAGKKTAAGTKAAPKKAAAGTAAKKTSSTTTKKATAAAKPAKKPAAAAKAATTKTAKK